MPDSTNRFRRGRGGPRRRGEGGGAGESDHHGTPQSEYPDTVRDRILEAARRSFAQHGFEGATMRSITLTAQTNLGSVNYYFHSKELLYIAVLMALVGPLGPRVEFAARREGTGLVRALGIVRVIFDYIRMNPDMPAIISREMASGHEIAGPIRTTMGRGMKALGGVIADGQKDGSIRAGDPVLLALSCVSQPVYLNLARRAIGEIAGIDVTDERVVEHAVGVVEAFLKS